MTTPIRGTAKDAMFAVLDLESGEDCRVEVGSINGDLVHVCFCYLPDNKFTAQLMWGDDDAGYYEAENAHEVVMIAFASLCETAVDEVMEKSKG